METKRNEWKENEPEQNETKEIETKRFIFSYLIFENNSSPDKTFLRVQFYLKKILICMLQFINNNLK